MSNQLKMMVGVAVFATLALAGALGAFVVSTAQPVQADGHSAARTFSAAANPGDDVMVTISVSGTGRFGNVIENLPQGFTYKAGSAMYDGEAADSDDVTVDGQEVTFALIGPVGTIEYTAETADTLASDSSYTFSGTVTDSNQDSRSVTGPAFMFGGDTTPTPTTPTATLDVPNKPNKSDSVELVFMAPNGGVDAGDYITIVLHEDFQVPDDIDKSDVSLAGMVQNVAGQSVFAVTPASVAVDDTDNLDGDFGNDADWLIQVQVPDTYPGTEGLAQGNQGLDGEITVTVAKAAGIRAPKEAGDYGVGYLLGKEPDDNDALAFDRTQVINRLVELSEEKKGRGANIEVTAKGFETGTVYFWRDGDLNNMLDGDEDVLCHGTVDDDHVATCSFELTNPPFMAEIGDCTSSSPDCNLVQAYDGVNRNNYAKASSGNDLMGNEVHEDQDDVIYLDKSITISPEQGNPGDRITLTLQDFPDDEPQRVTRVTVGGVEATQITGGSIRNGEATATVTIPDRAQTGIRQFKVWAADTDDDTEITIGGADLSASPAEVIPGQDVVLTGSGYYGGSCITGMVLGGVTTAFEGCNSRDEVTADNNGNWSYTVEIPVNGTTADAEGRSLTLRVADSQGRVGSMQLPFMEREVTMSPREGHPGTPMVLTGSGFPVDADVDIQYGTERPDGVDADSGGSWRHTMKVPDDAGIPSTNVVTVSFEAGTRTVTDTFTHRVPGATITLDPVQGPEGGMVTLTAGGFTRYASLDELLVDGRDATPSPAPSTDRNGNVTFQFRVPGSDPGVLNVEATFDNTTASTTFTVISGSGIVDGSVESILSGVMSEDALDRVFKFNNETKDWQWHINDPAFASTNNLDGLSSGDLVWIKVSKSVTADILGSSTTLTCINEGAENEDCWNQISIP